MQQKNITKWAYDNVYDSYDSSYDYTIYDNDFVFEEDEFEEENYDNNNYENDDETLEEDQNNSYKLPINYPSIGNNIH